MEGSRRRTTIVTQSGFNSLGVPIPPHLAKGGLPHEQRNQMYMQLLQNKMDDIQLIRRLGQQDIIDHNRYVNQFKEHRNDIKEKANVMEHQKLKKLKSIERFIA